MSAAPDVRLRAVVRYRYVLAVVVFLTAGVVGDHDEGDLPFFDIARHVLLSSHGLHLYALHPDIQIGPLALLGVLGSNALFVGQLTVAVVAASAVLLLLTMRSVERLACEAGVSGGRARAVVTVGGLALAASWAVAVPGWGHPDDLAALLAMTCALRSARGGHAVRTGLLLAAGIDCKPWAAFAVAIVLILPSTRRRGRSLLALAAGVAVAWGPFLIAAPDTLGRLASFQIPANPFSLPGLLGATETPHATRALQLLLATAAVALCLRLGRWELVLLVVAVSRLAVDGGAYPYYGVELVAGCLVADAVRAGFSNSVLVTIAPLTCLALAGMAVVHQIPDSHVAVPARLALYAVLLLCALAGRRERVSGTPGAEAAADRQLVTA